MGQKMSPRQNLVDFINEHSFIFRVSNPGNGNLFIVIN